MASQRGIRLEGDLAGLEAGIEALRGELGFCLAPEGIPVHVSRSQQNIEVSLENGRGEIRYNRKIHFFRALGLLLEALLDSPVQRKEEPQFDMNGVMVDASRNAVMKPDSIKILLRKMAVMGLDVLMLYTEDTYAIETQPYFGYMRGRYTDQECREINDYAGLFGIEVIPCIQTLAHLETFLQWDAAKELHDTPAVLLAGSDRTYALIEEMVTAAAKPFQSKKIHIGMDEAHGLGRGRYLDLNGYRPRFEIMTDHLQRVLSITRKLGLQPMIWSDMYVRIGSQTGDYYDEKAVIPEEVIENLPRDVKFVYWDYYHTDPEFYGKYIRLHKKFGSPPVFAGGIWTFSGVGTHYEKTFMATDAALSACKREGIKEVFTTIWMDDGGENNLFSSLLGLQLFAEHGYAKKLDRERVGKRFRFCTGADLQSFMLLGSIDTPPGAKWWQVLEPDNPGKYLLWQDILTGLFDRHAEGFDVASHYARLAKSLKACAARNGEWEHVFEVPVKLCEVLSLKSDIGIRLKRLYDEKNHGELAHFAKHVLPDLHQRVGEMRQVHRDQWFRIYKPFGWEVLDIRYGGLLARIDTAIKRLADFLDGRIERVEELEAERLFFDGLTRPEDGGLVRCNRYQRICTANVL
ncbi:beta-N-acetylhexosaminidase [Brevibacillus formosus]